MRRSENASNAQTEQEHSFHSEAQGIVISILFGVSERKDSVISLLYFRGKLKTDMDHQWGCYCSRARILCAGDFWLLFLETAEGGLQLSHW